MGSWLLLFWYGVIGPGILQRGEVVFQPAPLEASVPEPFRLEAQTYGYELQPILQTPRYNVSLVRFPSPITSPDAENNVVHAEFFEPVGFAGKRPAVVVLHILGADFPLSRYMAARLADQGVAPFSSSFPTTGNGDPATLDRPGDSSRRTSTAPQLPCDKGFVTSDGRFLGSTAGTASTDRDWVSRGSA